MTYFILDRPGASGIVAPETRIRSGIVEHWSSLHRLALFLTGDHHLANDVVQEAVAAALVRPHLLRPEIAIESLLGNLVRNAARSTRLRVRRERPVDWELVPDEMQPVAREAPLVDVVLRDEGAWLVRHAIAYLSHDQAELTRRVDLEGEPLLRAARSLSLSATTAFRRRRTALGRLRSALESSELPDDRAT